MPSCTTFSRRHRAPRPHYCSCARAPARPSAEHHAPDRPLRSAHSYASLAPHTHTPAHFHPHARTRTLSARRLVACAGSHVVIGRVTLGHDTLAAIGEAGQTDGEPTKLVQACQPPGRRCLPPAISAGIIRPRRDSDPVTAAHVQIVACGECEPGKPPGPYHVAYKAGSAKPRQACPMDPIAVHPRRPCALFGSCWLARARNTAPPPVPS